MGTLLTGSAGGGMSDDADDINLLALSITSSSSYETQYMSFICGDIQNRNDLTKA